MSINSVVLWWLSTKNIRNISKKAWNLVQTNIKDCITGLKKTQILMMNEWSMSKMYSHLSRLVTKTADKSSMRVQKSILRAYRPLLRPHHFYLIQMWTQQKAMSQEITLKSTKLQWTTFKEFSKASNLNINRTSFTMHKVTRSMTSSPRSVTTRYSGSRWTSYKLLTF